MKDVSTKDTLIETGARIMLEKGYNNTGLQEVLKKSKTPKGSFYHYFDSKEDFALSIIELYKRDSDHVLSFYLDERNIPPLERLRRFFEAAARRFDTEGCWGGCLFGNLGQELADQNPVLRDRVAFVLDGWRNRFADCIAQAAERGDIGRETSAEDLADFILDSWEGAILRMKVTKSVRPLDRFMHVIFGTVLAG